MSIFRGPAKVTAIESKDGVFNNGNATVGLGRGRWWALAERIFSTVRIPSPAVLFNRNLSFRREDKGDDIFHRRLPGL